MDKNIIHIKLPTDKYGNFLIDSRQTVEFVDYIKEFCNNNEINIIVSPFEITNVCGDQKIITIDCKQYSYDEIKKIIESYEKHNNEGV